MFMLIIRNVYVNAYTFCFLFLDKERDIIMELLQLVEKFKDVFSIEKIEDVVDELKSTLLNAENCRKLCEDWILICPDLTIDYMQMIFQYYFADRKEKMQDYTPKSLAVAVAELSKTKDEKICLDLCAGSGALTIQKWNENSYVKNMIVVLFRFCCLIWQLEILTPKLFIVMYCQMKFLKHTGHKKAIDLQLLKR